MLFTVSPFSGKHGFFTSKTLTIVFFVCEGEVPVRLLFVKKRHQNFFFKRLDCMFRRLHTTR